VVGAKTKMTQEYAEHSVASLRLVSAGAVTDGVTTGAALVENNEASAKLTTANGGTFTSSSARLSSQSRYSTLDQ